MSKKIKALELDTLRKAFGTAKDYIVIEPIKVDAATDFQFRKTLRAKKIRVQMVKNSYAKKIFNENGINTGDVWSSTTLLCWGGANIKELSNSVDTAIKDAKKDAKAPDKFKVKTAVADGNPVSLADAKKMPTREEAVAEVLGTILGPGANLLAAIMGPVNELAGLVHTIEDAAEKAAAAVEKAAPAEVPEAAPAAS